jgi:hypothetical protein
MWWQKAGASPTPAAVFEATRISRHLYLFQSIFCNDVIGTTASALSYTTALADVTECKLQSQCDDMLAKWKGLQREEADNQAKKVRAELQWSGHFRACKCNTPYNNVGAWIEKHVATAAATEGYFNNANRANGGGRGRGGGEGRGGRGGRR